MPPAGGRGTLTLIYILLVSGRPSWWHRIDAVEIWHITTRALPSSYPAPLEVESTDKP